jgi:hypothetical protein
MLTLDGIDDYSQDVRKEQDFIRVKSGNADANGAWKTCLEI